MNRFLISLFWALTLTATAYGQSNRTRIADETARAIAAETALQEAIDDLPVFVDAPTGTFKVDEFQPETPINTSSNAVGTNIDLDMDLTQAEGLTLKLLFADQSTGIAWQQQAVDVDRLLLNFAADSALDGYALVFDNDWVRINVVDPVQGILNFVDMGRDMQFVKAELFITAPTVHGLITVQNPVTIVTTGAFQPFGDRNPLFTGDDGDSVHIEYGDGNRDQLTFIDGTARAERRGFGTNDLELRIVDGQIEVRDLNDQSSISFMWYETMQGVVRTQTLGQITSSDLSAVTPIEAIEVNQAYPTGRTIGGLDEYEALIEYALDNHTASTTINVSPVTGFTGPISAILAMTGGADNGTLFQALEASEITVDRTTGAIAHTYQADRSGFTMRLTLKWLQ